jgi:hypothetical protein
VWLRRVSRMHDAVSRLHHRDRTTSGPALLVLRSLERLGVNFRSGFDADLHAIAPEDPMSVIATQHVVMVVLTPALAGSCLLARSLEYDLGLRAKSRGSRPLTDSVRELAPAA